MGRRKSKSGTKPTVLVAPAGKPGRPGQTGEAGSARLLRGNTEGERPNIRLDSNESFLRKRRGQSAEPPCESQLELPRDTSDQRPIPKATARDEKVQEVLSQFGFWSSSSPVKDDESREKHELFIAISTSDFGAVKSIIEGAKTAGWLKDYLESKNSEGETPLIAAILWYNTNSAEYPGTSFANSSYNIVEFLIDTGADLYTQNSHNGKTPLYYATATPEILELFIKKRIDVNRLQPNGLTILGECLREQRQGSDCSEAIAILTAAGAKAGNWH